MFFVICIGVALAILFQAFRNTDEQVAHDAIKEIRDLLHRVEERFADQREFSAEQTKDILARLKAMECQVIDDQATLLQAELENTLSIQESPATSPQESEST